MFNEGVVVQVWNRKMPITTMSFLAQDTLDYVDSFVEIYQLHVAVENRGKGLGRKYMTGTLEEYRDSVIMLRAGISKYEYPTYPEPDEADAIVERLVNFYESLNFKDVNDLIGCTEDSVTMLYVGNEKGKDFFNKLGVKALTDLNHHDYFNFYLKHKEYCDTLPS